MASQHHEDSLTVERDGKFYNVSGHTGTPLPVVFGYEKRSYRTLGAALVAADRRSRDWNANPALAALVGGDAARSAAMPRYPYGG